MWQECGSEVGGVVSRAGRVTFARGHKDPRMLMRYTHLRAEDLARKLGWMLVLRVHRLEAIQ